MKWLLGNVRCCWFLIRSSYGHEVALLFVVHTEALSVMQQLTAKEKFQPGFSAVCLTEQVCIHFMWVTLAIACRHSCCDLLTCSFSSVGYLDLCKSLKVEIKYKSGMRQTTLKSLKKSCSLPPSSKKTHPFSDLSLILKTCLQSWLKQYEKLFHKCMCMSTFMSTSCVCRHKWAKVGLMSGSHTCLSPESTCWANFDPFRASCREFKGSERANERLEGHRWEMPPEECMLLFHWFYGNMDRNDTVKVGFHLTPNQTGRKWDGDSHCLSAFSRKRGWEKVKGEEKKNAVLIFWSLHFPSGLVSNKLPRPHPCTHQSHYPSPPSWRHWVNSAVCRETRINNIMRLLMMSSVFVCMCICLLAVFCLEFTCSDELALTQESYKIQGGIRNTLQKHIMK